jgi:hypothetical protein
MKNDLLCMANSEIDKIIHATFEDETEREIVRSRIIDGMTYNAIFKKYFNDECSDRVKDKIIRSKIHPLIHKLYKAVNVKWI